MKEKNCTQEKATGKDSIDESLLKELEERKESSEKILKERDSQVEDRRQRVRDIHEKHFKAKKELEVAKKKSKAHLMRLKSQVREYKAEIEMYEDRNSYMAGEIKKLKKELGIEMEPEVKKQEQEEPMNM